MIKNKITKIEKENYEKFLDVVANIIIDYENEFLENLMNEDNVYLAPCKDFLLSKMLKCPTCNSKIIPKIKKKSTKKYICQHCFKRNSNINRGNSINIYLIETNILIFVINIFLNEMFRENICDEIYMRLKKYENALLELNGEKLNRQVVFYLLCKFDSVINIMSDDYKSKLIGSIISEIYIYDEEDQLLNDSILKRVKFKFPLYKEIINSIY